MRALASLALALLTLAALPARAQDAPGAPTVVTENIVLSHHEPNVLLKEFVKEHTKGAQERRVPAGVVAIASFEKSFLIKGETAAVRVLMDALRTIDVPVEPKGGGVWRAELIPRRANPSELRTGVLTLPDAGKAALRDGKLVLEGKVEWLRQALIHVLWAEMAPPKAEQPAPAGQ